MARHGDREAVDRLEAQERAEKKKASKAIRDELIKKARERAAARKAREAGR